MRFLPLLLAFLLPIQGGCRGGGPEDDLPVAARVSFAPTPPIVGPNRVVIELRDRDGAPVEGARVQVDGTMNHAGMVPVVRDAEPSGEGRHVIPDFDFSMGGSWVLLLRIRLADGEAVTREHRVRVVSGGPAPSGS